jgi:hypothetical protein
MDKASKPPAGFSADTEILTRSQSWIRFDKLTAFDEVATRTPDGEFRWEHPERVIWQPYSGDMVWGHSRSADLMVTPGTLLLAHKRERFWRNGKSAYGEYQEYLRDAGYFVGTQEAHLVATSRWAPTGGPREIHLKPTIVREFGKQPLSFTASSSDFAAFMGMYLAEGSLACTTLSGVYTICIWQSAVGNGLHAYQERLNAMLGREVPWMKKGFFALHNKALFEYLKPLGGHSYEKVIPPEVLDLGPGDLETFWEFFCLGDGNLSWNLSGKEVRSAYSTSLGLMDGLQEILQKMGGWAIRRLMPADRGPGPKGEIKVKRRPCYKIYRRHGDVASATNVDRISYEGPIGSVVVPADVVYVRRGGWPIWAGSA